jgi:hypothetical protein
MKKIIFYYLAIIIPIPMLIGLSGNSKMFVVFLLFYAIYRGFVDGQRLIEKGILKEKQLWKAFIPFWCSRYYRQLYFEK